ncbi:hypothetical protein [Flammeovirga agarivorans]|uniref:Uncharacterized protein n=1 Tax=Flammeovirga agarivorans TaxID=2726742 RepID=A0A7X8SR47_9BACT|nr:hypothetical protein [Flammeovirga agarivorans]NLR94871.1 hypothetical protein [Flammeovirga agarivorans]
MIIVKSHYRKGKIIRSHKRAVKKSFFKRHLKAIGIAGAGVLALSAATAGAYKYGADRGFNSGFVHGARKGLSRSSLRAFSKGVSSTQSPDKVLKEYNQLAFTEPVKAKEHLAQIVVNAKNFSSGMSKRWKAKYNEPAITINARVKARGRRIRRKFNS